MMGLAFPMDTGWVETYGIKKKKKNAEDDIL